MRYIRHLGKPFYFLSLLSRGLFLRNLNRQRYPSQILSINLGDIDINEFSGINGVKALISGSGNIYTNRTVTGISKVEAVISGSGDFQGFGFNTNNSDVLISGSGNVETTASEALSIKISGSGNVYYKGFPAINTNITGSGNVINRN